MKQLTRFLAIAIIATTIFSCSKENIDQSQQTLTESSIPIDSRTVIGSALDHIGSATDHLCDSIMVVDLVASTGDVIGFVFVGNDDDNLLVGYFTTDAFLLQDTHLYVGDCDSIPLTGSGAPKLRDFPYHHTNVPPTHIYSYSIPLDGLDSCFCIVAQAKFIAVSETGSTLYSGVAYGDGISFGTPLNASYFEYCQCVE